MLPAQDPRLDQVLGLVGGLRGGTWGLTSSRADEPRMALAYAVAVEAEPSPVPRTVRTAGVLVALQGVVPAVIVVALVVRAFTGAPDITTALGTALWFAFVAAALIAIGVALWRGQHGARTPAVVAQLLLLGVAWYAAGPSARPEFGVPGAVYCVGALILLFCAPTVRWAHGVDADGRIFGQREAG